jgi:hypothetical protein
VAPFLSHLVVGERMWVALDGWSRRSEDYGTFLFGCLAPDVDKFCVDLEQGTTHFVAKDESNAFMWRRTRRFIEHQDDFLRAPFHSLETGEQAFVLGYLCHVATDEITGRIALAIQGQLTAAREAIPHVDALLTAMDPRSWRLASGPQRLVSALEEAAILPGVFPFTSRACLDAMHQIVLPQIREGGGLEPYLRMVRRLRQWVRHGRVSDAADDPDLEAGLAAYRRQIEAGMPTAERLIETMDLESFVDRAVDHSLVCAKALMAGEEGS